MRAVWVDVGNDLDMAKARLHGITTAYFGIAESSDVLQRRCLDARNAGFAVGVYIGHAWWELFDGRSIAEKMHQVVSGTFKWPQPSWPKVQFNYERHDPAQVLAMLRRWRELRPKQDTSWTMEPMQGGWMSKDFVDEVISLRVRVVPQCFTGTMARFESDVVLRDLTRRGFPEALVSPFYDAANLGIGWDGFCFTQNRLP